MIDRRLHRGAPSPCLVLLLGACLAAAPGPAAWAAKVYIVKRGDTLTAIAQRYDVSTKDLASANALKSRDAIVIGQKLTIPEGASRLAEYVVAKGDTLDSIAKRYGIPTSDLIAYNKIKRPNLIAAGQTLIIPGARATASSPASGGGSFTPAPASAYALTAQPELWTQINRTPVQPGRWKYIVIHHSASTKGSTASIDYYHRYRRHMENGLAYHFVIGNGRGMSMGKINVGNRWVRQIDGGHLKSDAQNRVSIGICLIGNFDNAPPPQAEMQSLYRLVKALMKKCNLGPDAVKTHRQINTLPTACPGRYFPEQAFMRSLRG